MIQLTHFCDAVIGIGTECATQTKVPFDPWSASTGSENQEFSACIRKMLEAMDVEDFGLGPIIGAVHAPPYKSWIKPQLNFLKRMDSFGPHANTVLGPAAGSRLEEFKNYKHGWDFGRGEPLSSICIALVDSFVNKYSNFGSTPPSLFLTRQGNLQLNWEDEAGLPVEVEFSPSRLEFYIGRNSEEGTIDIDEENPLESLELVIKKIS